MSDETEPKIELAPAVRKYNQTNRRKKHQRTLAEAISGKRRGRNLRKHNAARMKKHTRRKVGKASDGWFARAQPWHPHFDPVLAEKHFKMTQANGRNGRRGGIPRGKGWTAETWYPYMEECMAKAKQIVDVLDEQELIELDPTLNVSDKDAAKEALALNIVVVRNPHVSLKDRLSAANTVLNFCKVKPATKTEVAVKTAEDWLTAIADNAGI